MADSIFLVEDHPVVRRGLTTLIEPEEDLMVTGSTGSAPEARTRISEEEPDLVLLDLSLDEGTGLGLLNALGHSHPDLPILVVSMHDEIMYARRALDAGAEGYLMKSEANEKVVQAIRRVLGGDVYLSQNMTTRLLSDYVGGREPQEEAFLNALTDRELEVFTFLGKGYERREIAETLALSPKTIDTHRENLKEKLSLDTNAGLRRFAAVWIELDHPPTT